MEVSVLILKKAPRKAFSIPQSLSQKNHPKNSINNPIKLQPNFLKSNKKNVP